MKDKRLKTWLFLLNYYAHDFLTGVWGACFLVLTILRFRYGGPETSLPTEVAAVLGDMGSLFFWLELAALGLLAVTGMGRAFDPNLGYQAEGAQREKRLFLVIKHIVMGVVFVGGTLASYFWAFSF